MGGRGRQRAAVGVTLPELLVVMAIVGLAVAVAVPVVGDAIRSARIRVSADQLAVTLKAARMIAVSRQSPVDVVVYTAPVNAYEYTDATDRLRRYDLPSGVRVVSPTTTLTFRTNGSTSAITTHALEVTLHRGAIETWQIRTNLLGVSEITRTRSP